MPAPLSFSSLDGIAARDGFLSISTHFGQTDGGKVTKVAIPIEDTFVLKAALGASDSAGPQLMTALTRGLGLAALVIGIHLPGKEIRLPR